ncbi:HD family phosphohydrolase [Paenibacillus sp. JSM ZJ436]|uniref:HD family phosphohydrolase n=1 Tax=Paenibacillus sp. JSM ZJ436 TaxID=3376190 RepID=UPI00379EF5A2
MAPNKPSTDKSMSIRHNGWKYSVATRYILFLLLALLIYISLSLKLLPERYDIQVGTRSEKSIPAPAQIEDSKATLKAQEEAAERVQPIYTYIPLRNDILVQQLFERIDRLNQDEVSVQDKISIYREEIPQRVDEFVDSFISSNQGSEGYPDELLDEMKTVIEQQAYRVPEETFIKIPRLEPEEISKMKTVARDIVSRLMNEIVDAQTARAKVAELVSTSSLSDRTSREVVQELARLVITANKFYNEVATKEAKVEARENTPPVYIKQGDILVQKGQLITPELYDLLGKNGLLKDEVTYWPEVGLLLFSILLSLGLLMFIRQSDVNIFKYNNSQILMLVLIYVITLICMHLAGFLQSEERVYVGYLAPVAIGVILVTLLMDMRLAYFSVIIFSILSSVILNVDKSQMFDFRFGFFAVITSCVALFAIHRASQRSALLKGGIMVSLFGALSVLILLLVHDSDWSRSESMYALAFAVASGILTAVLVIGLMPFFEVTFGILSALKLVELSNPNHPLLRKLLTETPGTYHHSVMVGNLSEAAAEAIGADGLLCRVGSYYHDVGKTKRPMYFIENQSNMENPHDSLEPKLSKSIIVAHARDGVEMQKDYNLPKPIRDIAEQHHGTSFLHFFYHKALKQAQEQGSEPDFTEDDFRYPGPKAQSKEAAIVGIADSVEAAVRSLRKPTVEQVETMIEKIIKGRVDDNQFNECDLTMKELDVIAKTLKATVMGIFHSRIEYPEEMKKSKPESAEAQSGKPAAEQE